MILIGIALHICIIWGKIDVSTVLSKLFIYVAPQFFTVIFYNFIYKNSEFFIIYYKFDVIYA